MRSRIAQMPGRLLFLVAAAGVYVVLAPHWAKDNVIHVVLGGDRGRAEVTELHLRYAVAPKSGQMAEDWTREATFRFPDGSAPRVVTHEPRLADGDYVVEIEILKPPHPELTIDRRVTLEGSTTSIDVSSDLLGGGDAR
jgi:hypothetical protein